MAINNVNGKTPEQLAAARAYVDAELAKGNPKYKPRAEFFAQQNHNQTTARLDAQDKKMDAILQAVFALTKK
jgi:hypothetical protein